LEFSAAVKSEILRFAQNDRKSKYRAIAAELWLGTEFRANAVFGVGTLALGQHGDRAPWLHRSVILILMFMLMLMPHAHAP
jgi:hypothetical protein